MQAKFFMGLAGRVFRESGWQLISPGFGLREECYQILDDMTFDLFARMLAAGRLASIAKRAALLFHLQMSRTVSDAGLFRLE